MPIIINSKFRPFSFQEMLQPVAMAAQAHQALEDQYAELGTKASVWEKLKDSEIDRDVYQQYKSYSDALKSSSDELAQFGLTPSSRRAMLDIRARYSKDITPIEQAWDRREQEAQQQREANIKSGGKNIYSRNARNTSLSDYINDRVQDYSTINLDNIMNEGLAAGKAISSRYFRTEEGKRFGGDYYNLTTKQGLSPQEAFALLNDPDKYPEFSRFIHDIQGKYQIRRGQSLYSDTDTERANNALMQGINMGIVYDEKDTQLKNWRGEMVAQAALKGGKTTTSSAKFSSRIMEGASGSTNPDVERVRGLRPTANGFSTTELDKRQGELSKAQKKLDDFLDSLSESDRKRVTSYTPEKIRTTAGAGSYGSLGKSIASSTSQPREYGEYEQLKKERDKLQAAYDEEKKFLESLENKYAHLGTGYEAIFIGTKLADTQEKQAKSSFALNVDDTEYDKVRARLGNIYGSFSKETYGAKTVGVFDKDGKKMDYEDVRAMFSEEDKSKKPTIKVTGGKNTDVHIVYKGKEYTMSGLKSIDDYKKDLKAVNDFLSDFSISALNTPQGSVGSFESATSQNLIPLSGNLVGLVVYDPSNPMSMTKVIVDKSTNKIAAVNSISDELSGGQNRDSYFINMATRGLDELSAPVKHDN